MILHTGGADFVFEDGYGLPPFNWVEQNKQEEGNLRGLSAEAQNKEQGVSVAEMITKILQDVDKGTIVCF